MIDALVHDRLLDWPDVTGRLLGEQASAAYATAAADTRPCPHPGSRRGEPMNAGAWGQVARHLPEVLAALRARSGPTASQAWRATIGLRFAPLELELPVTEVVAATFKTALGLERPLCGWLLHTPGSAARPLSALVGPDRIVERLEAEGWLHGSRQVCAAPPEVLVAAWSALCVGEDTAPDDAAALLVSGLWAVLGTVRERIRAGDVPRGWSPVRPWCGEPRVLGLLAARGAGALVREVPEFPAVLVRRLWDPVPDPLERLLDACAGADLAGLDPVWDAWVREVRPLWGC